VLFVIIFILKASATHIAEWGIGSENNCWVIDGTKVDCLDVIKVVVNLEVVGIVCIECLPFMSNFIESICSQVGRNMFIGTIGTNHSFDVSDRSCKL